MTATLIQGEPELWDRKWRQMHGTQNQCLFSRDKSGLSLYQHYLRAYFSLLWEALPWPPDGKSFLEIGAGRGTVSQYLADKGCEVTLLDLSQAGFDMARENWQAFEMPLPKFLIADVCNTGLDDESYDCVHSVGLLEHFDDPGEVLREAHRICSKGGVNHHIIINNVGGGSEQVHRVSRTTSDWQQYVPVPVQCRQTVFTGVHELWWYK